MANLTRRSFLKGSSICLTALGGMQLGLRMNPAHAAVSGDRFVVYLFLRGGMDGLNFVCPIAGPDRTAYEMQRPNIHIRTTGATAALPLGASNFGLNFAATALHQLYGQNKLAIVHGCGFPVSQITRSHFDAQDYLESGTPGSSAIGTGWLARHLASAGQVPDAAVIPSLSAGTSSPTSMRGRRDNMVLDDATSFHPNANSTTVVDGQPAYKFSTTKTLRELYAGTGNLDVVGTSAVDTIELVDTLNIASYTPSAGAVYPTTGPATTLANQAKLIANIAKRNIGLQVATLDYGGWDTHENQGDGTQADLNLNQYANRVAGLSQTLNALYTDLAVSGLGDRMVVVVQSEFGRRVRENANRGTDHGSANPILLLGDRVRGGLYGTFGGLNSGQLYQNEDLATTTDYRRVLSEVVVSHLGNNDLASVFPGYAYGSGMGVLPTDSLFASGFDSA